ESYDTSRQCNRALCRGVGVLPVSCGCLETGMARGIDLQMARDITARMVGDLNPRDGVAALWFSRPVPSAARTTIQTRIYCTCSNPQAHNRAQWDGRDSQILTYRRTTDEDDKHVITNANASDSLSSAIRDRQGQ